MSEIVHLEQYQRWRTAPPLVLIDMVQDQIAPGSGLGSDEVDPVVDRCRLLLEEARARHWPVAFVRSATRRTNWRVGGGTRWLPGFEPRRSDMVFDRPAHSCYSSNEFAGAMDAAGRVFVVAGFSGDTAGLSTLMDASRHDHFVGLVQDASATSPLPGHDAAESHRAVVAVAGRYATVVTAQHWIDVTRRATAPEKEANVRSLR